MARNKTIKILRTTRANLNTQKNANALIEGEPYLITDERRLAVGIGNNDYEDFAKLSEAVGGITFNHGLATRSGNASSGDQTIAHGLGKTPAVVKLVAMKSAGDNGGVSLSFGSYKSGSVRSLTAEYILSINSSTSNIISIVDYGGGNKQEATISVDSTNITLSWTKTGTPSSSTIIILWEVYA